ncbi:glycosyltransferase family 4 protein [Falsiroseomonas sp. HW251]|uniref:glycosyltransferase family 4 protein n=1 Tax=Falsiroseomonas sp. HW251 TaxID=3390998 RepID=UPI003D31594E
MRGPAGAALTMRILLSGIACAPDAGSEPGITWNWAENLAADHDVWVITHEYFRPAIERYLAEHPLPRLRFTYTGRLGWWDMLRLPSQRGIRLHYVAWQRHVLRIARELDAEHDFDLIHHVSWSTIGAPPRLGELGKPFIWGPLGGGQTTPWPLLREFGWQAPLEVVRSLRIALLPYLPSVRRAARQARLVMAVNNETAAVLRRAGVQRPRLFVDVGVPPRVLDAPLAERPTQGPFTVFFAGQIELRKGIGLLLEVARKLRGQDIRFVVVGDGPNAAAVRRRAEELGLPIRFLGKRPWREVQDLYRSAHVFLFTSIRDSFGTTTLEALAGGAPVICIDHQGAGAHLPNDATVKVPVGPREQVAESMARAVLDLAADRPRLAAMSRAGRLWVLETEAWDRRTERMERIYEQVLAPVAGPPAPRRVESRGSAPQYGDRAGEAAGG